VAGSRHLSCLESVQMGCGPTWPPTQWNGCHRLFSCCEAARTWSWHTYPSSTKVENEWSYALTPSAFMACTGTAVIYLHSFLMH